MQGRMRIGKSSPIHPKYGAQWRGGIARALCSSRSAGARSATLACTCRKSVYCALPPAPMATSSTWLAMYMPCSQAGRLKQQEGSEAFRSSSISVAAGRQAAAAGNRSNRSHRSKMAGTGRCTKTGKAGSSGSLAAKAYRDALHPREVCNELAAVHAAQAAVQSGAHGAVQAGSGARQSSGTLRHE